MSWVHYFFWLRQRPFNTAPQTKLTISICWWYCTMGFFARFAAKLLQQDLLNLAMWCAKWRIELNPEKNKVIILSRSKLTGKTEPNLKLYVKTLKVYPQVKFLGISFDSQLTFMQHFEDILDSCNIRYHRLKLLANKKWAIHLNPNLQTMCATYFWVRLSFDNYHLGQYHQQNSMAPKQVYSTCPSFTKIHSYQAAPWLHWPSICER